MQIRHFKRKQKSIQKLTKMEWSHVLLGLLHHFLKFLSREKNTSMMQFWVFAHDTRPRCKITKIATMISQKLRPTWECVREEHSKSYEKLLRFLLHGKLSSDLPSTRSRRTSKRYHLCPSIPPHPEINSYCSFWRNYRQPRLHPLSPENWPQTCFGISAVAARLPDVSAADDLSAETLDML